MKKITLMFAMLLLTSFSINAQNLTSKQKAEKYLSVKGELTFTFKVNGHKEIDNFTKDLSIVNYNPQTKTVIAWANENQFRVFESKNIAFEVPKKENEVDEATIYDVRPLASRNGQANTLTFPVTTYPTYAEYAQQMQDFEDDNPTLIEKVSIGTTTQGDKELLFVKISDNVGTDEQEPKLMLTSSMHGDEIAGYPMMLSLIDYILTVYANTGHADHARVKNLVENAEIWINPNANPDGTYHNSSSNTSVVNSRRGNANNVDLNRNYPDNVAGPHDDGNAYQVETLAFMALADNNHFVISANFHGGTELVNYPFDNAYVSQYTHPDGNWFEYIGVEYATHAQNDSDASPYFDTTYMTADDDSDVYPSPGVTHGAEWYRVYGGRQDYMNFYHQCKEVTIELSDTKILPESQLDDYWYYNRDALLDFLTQGTYGFNGVVKDANTGNPIEATVTIVGHDNYGSHTVTDISHGDYYRPIKAGTYDILFEAPCYQSVTRTGQAISDYQNVTLTDVLLTPGAEVPSGVSVSAIGSTTATVDWDAQTGNTFDFRYREVGATTWTTITNLTPNTYDISGLTVGVQYEAQVRSICGAYPPSSYSDSTLFTTQISYCDAQGNTSFNTGVTNVTFNTINNSDVPKNVGYEDFTSISTNVTQGTSHDLTVKVNTDGDYRTDAYAWIDWNQDGDFLDSGESYDLGDIQDVTDGATGLSPLSIFIPETSGIGITRLRVAAKYNSDPTSCETNFDGEVEDYTLNIIDNTLSNLDFDLNEISIHPNPFNDKINIKLPTEAANNLKLTLYDIRGRIIESHNSQSNTLVLNNLNSLSKGTYFLKIIDNNDGTQITKKVIKQ